MKMLTNLPTMIAPLSSLMAMSHVIWCMPLLRIWEKTLNKENEKTKPKKKSILYERQEIHNSCLMLKASFPSSNLRLFAMSHHPLPQVQLFVSPSPPISTTDFFSFFLSFLFFFFFPWDSLSQLSSPSSHYKYNTAQWTVSKQTNKWSETQKSKLLSV